MFDDDPQEIGDFDTVLTRWIDGSPVCRSVDNFDIRKFKGIKPVYLPPIRKVYPDPDQKWNDLGEFVQQSWQDFYDAPMPEKEKQNMFASINSNNVLLGNGGVGSDTLTSQKKDISVQPSQSIPGYHVYDRSGEYLFSLGDSRNPAAQKITAKELYDKGLQWFAPTAENFIPMDTINPAIAQNAGVLHVNGEDIYNFANGRDMLEYGSGGAGDWKMQPEGGKGYMLAEVNRLPYWVDALGQIPFTIDAYRYFYSSPFNADKRNWMELTGKFSKLDMPRGIFSLPLRLDEKLWSKIMAVIFGGGRYFSIDGSNSYDNYMINKTSDWYRNIMLPYEWRKRKGQLMDANDSIPYHLNALYDYGYNFRRNK